MKSDWQVKSRLFGLLSGGAAVLLYHLLTHYNLVNNNILVPLPKVLEALSKWYTSGNLVTDLFSTLLRVGIGFFLGAGAGILVAVILSLSTALRHLLTPIIEFFRVISPLAWIPFAILFFRLGHGPALFLVSIASFFPTFTSTISAVALTKRSYLEMAEILGASRLQKVRYVYLPHSLPQVIGGLRISLGISWYVVVAAEMLGAQSGLGYAIQANKLTLQMEYVIAAILVIGVVGVALSMILGSIDRHCSRWIDSRGRF